MKIDKRIPVFGDVSVRIKKPPSEDVEQVTIFNWLNLNYPDDFNLSVHVKQEGLKSQGEAQKDKMMGLRKGWCDITIIGNPVFLCELKRADFTKGKISPDQEDFLIKSQERGAFVGLALGHKGFIEMFKEWKCIQTIKNG